MFLPHANLSLACRHKNIRERKKKKNFCAREGKKQHTHTSLTHLALELKLSSSLAIRANKWEHTQLKQQQQQAEARVFFQPIRWRKRIRKRKKMKKKEATFFVCFRTNSSAGQKLCEFSLCVERSKDDDEAQKMEWCAQTQKSCARFLSNFCQQQQQAYLCCLSNEEKLSFHWFDLGKKLAKKPMLLLLLLLRRNQSNGAD